MAPVPTALAHPRVIKAAEQKGVADSTTRGSITDEALRAYLQERRRALLTELQQLNKLLGFNTTE